MPRQFALVPSKSLPTITRFDLQGSVHGKTERRDFWEICEERLPDAEFDPDFADAGCAPAQAEDAILDRLVQHAHRIEMRGDSMRKNRGKTGG